MAKGGGSANKTYLYQQTKAPLTPRVFALWFRCSSCLMTWPTWSFANPRVFTEVLPSTNGPKYVYQALHWDKTHNHCYDVRLARNCNNGSGSTTGRGGNPKCPLTMKPEALLNPKKLEAFIKEKLWGATEKNMFARHVVFDRKR